MVRYLDRWSAAVLALTVILFMLALFLHGFTRDLLLEAGVLMVSAKLVIMSHKSSVLGEHLNESLNEIKTLLARSPDQHGKQSP